MDPEALLVINQVSKKYQGVPVIQNLSFSLNGGERLALFAPSGAGKTTLLRILAGLETADSGDFLLLGSAPAVIFQEPRLFPFLTLEENIFLPFEAQHKNITPQVKKDYRQWLEVCELGDSGKQYPYQLSGGMKQKAAIIRAMLGKPPLVLMDEPFQSIGAEAKANIIQHILTTAPDLTALFITHIPDEIPLMAHSVLYFQHQILANPLVLPAESFCPEKYYYPIPIQLNPAQPIPLDQSFHMNRK
jgi:ABC-type nitrate/sulfonate/bicarbonate transport system ATPase subunit